MSTQKSFGIGQVNASSHRGIDRHGAKRTVPMEVLCLGLPRTGTASMLTALKQLGYQNIHHMVRCIENIPDNDIWHEAVKAKWFGTGTPFGRKEFDQVLGHCMATTDWPTVAFADDLIKAYPEAKVILSVREFEPWYKSITNTIGKGLGSPVLKVIAYIDPQFFGVWFWMVSDIWKGFFGNPGCDRAMLKKKFDDHHEMVRRLVPPERLLEYRLGDGWEPVCQFLNKKVPEDSFPRVNESATFDETLGNLVKARMRVLMGRTLQVVAPVVLAGVAVYFARSGGLI